MSQISLGAESGGHSWPSNDDELLLALLTSLGDKVERQVDYKGPIATPRVSLKMADWDGVCDICGEDQLDLPEVIAVELDNWFLWATDDMYPKWAGNETWMVLCVDCNIKEVSTGLEKDKAPTVDAAPPAAKGAPNTYISGKGYYDQDGVFKPYSYAGNAALKALPKACLEAHFTELKPKAIGLPKTYGYLRLSSERGGLYIDTDVDYGLFFSAGWEHVEGKSVTMLDVGSVRPNDIPVFGEDDRSDWPPMAVIEWPDMKAPPERCVKYAVWAHEQWKSGKSIQFGCYGAHGRTGTFLGALFVLAGLAKTGQEAQDLVHKHHCKDAIETAVQRDWLKAFADARWGDKVANQ